MRLIEVLVFVGLLPGCVWGQEAGSGKAKATESTEKYSAESLVTERQDTIYRYASDGTGSKEITAVLRMQSEAAARQFGVLTIPFAGSNERVEIDYVRVRKPDGSVVETPATDAQEMPQEVTRIAPFYSDLKEKQLPVRNLRAGDRLEYQARILRTKAEAPGEFWGQEGFGSGIVVLDESIELHVPKGKYVKVWSPEHAPEADRTQLGKQQLIIGAWDTLGWVLFREDKVDEAEGYVRASWLNQPRAEVGLHLGEIQEKKNREPAALGIYELALLSGSQQTPKGFTMKGPDKIKTELQARESALKRRGILSGIKDGQNALIKQRILPMGKCEEKNSVAEYSIVVSGEKATELQKAPTHGLQLEDGDTRVRRAELRGWTPPGSSAKLVRKGMLNCHSGECEFVMYPM